jgi:PAS domain S-box-containing protein
VSLAHGAEAHLERAALAAAANGVMITDVRGRIVSVNAAFTRLTGYAAEEAVGQTPRILRSGLMPPGYYEELWATILAGRVFSGEVVNRRKDGSTYVEEQTITPVPGPDGKPTHFVAIKQDVTRRREAEEAMRAAKLAAEEATQAKSHFLAMSHEIRTPMNAVIGVAELLLDTTLDDRQRELVEMLRQSGEGLLGLIDEILDFSKVEAGRLDLASRPFDPAAAVEDRLHLVAPRAEARGVDLTWRVSTAVPASLLGDEQRFGQVVMNLLGNALKFTEHGSVEVSLDAERSPAPSRAFRGVLTLKDTGVGIPEAQLPRLFQPFEQGDPSSRRRFKGTGLGLAISRRIAQAMGGDIVAESDGAGRGATFRFHFEAAPLGPPPDSDRALRGVRALVLGERSAATRALADQLGAWGLRPVIAARLEDARLAADLRLALVVAPFGACTAASTAAALQAAWRDAGRAGSLPVVLLCAASQRGSLDAEAARAGAIAALQTWPPRAAALRRALGQAFASSVLTAPAPARPSPSQVLRAYRPRILVVEDDPVNRMVFTRMLEGFGLSASQAHDGGEAITAAERERFDLIFMDMQLPGVDGVEATRALRARPTPGARPPRIVAVTSNAFPEDRRRCLDAGMDDFLAKPVRRADLAAALDRAERAVRPGSDPAPRPFVDGPVLRELLASLGSVGDDTDELFRTLLGNAETLVAEVERAHAEGDRSALRRHAHTLKSNARMFALGPLGDVCAALEDIARGTAPGDPTPHVAGLRELFEKSRVALLGELRG